MKKFYLLLLLLISIALLVIWRKQSTPQNGATPIADANSNNPPRAAGDQKAPQIQKPKISVDPQPGEPQYPQYYLEQSRLDRQFDWKRPINFYGRVVDENEQAVAGVAVGFSWNDISATGTSKDRTTSDAGGFFSLLNRTGKILTVTVTKEGYYTFLDSKQPSFEYASPYQGLFVPDANNPVVFHLRKKGVAEPLVLTDYPGFAHFAQIHRDGTPIDLDLFKGTTAQTGQGDIRFEFWAENQKTQKRFDWTCRITVPNGGIQETTEEFNFLAPTNGYTPFFELPMPLEGNTNWQTRVERKFFVKLKNGNYGRVDFRLIAYNGVIEVGAAVNPSGSRKLEFDPAVQPKQTQFE